MIETLFGCETGYLIITRDQDKHVVIKRFEFMINDQSEALHFEEYDGFDHKKQEIYNIDEIRNHYGTVVYDRYAITKDTPVETPVVVWDQSGNARTKDNLAHFHSMSDEGKVLTFNSGRTSFTSPGEKVYLSSWDCGRIAEVMK